jgi:hypothetical protein
MEGVSEMNFKARTVLAVFLLSIVFGRSIAIAQTAVAKWNLTADSSISTRDANLQATAVTFNNLFISSATTPVAYSATYGMATAPAADGKSWNKTFDDTKYLQFAVTVNSGYVLTVSSISFDIGSYGGNSMYIAMYYSLNSDFSNSQAIVSTSNPISNSNGITNQNTMYSLTESVSPGAIDTAKTIYIRVYSRYNTSGARWLLLRNFTVWGTLATLPPSISTSTQSLSAFTQTSALPSDVQRYTLSGVALASDVVAKPSSGFQLSSDGSNWVSYPDSVVVGQSGGTLVGQPLSMYVRMNTSTAGINKGSITHTSSGASTVTVALTGTRVSVYYSNSTGALTDVSSWDTDSSGIGTNPPASFTADGQTFIVRNRASASLASSWLVTGSGSNIVVGDGLNTIDFTIPAATTITGTVNLTANSKLILQNSAYPTFGTIHSTSTIAFDGSNTLTIPAMNYGNLSSTNDVGATRILASGTIGIAGTFNCGSAAYTHTSDTLSFNGTSAQVIPAFVYKTLSIDNGSCTTGGKSISVSDSCFIHQNFIVAADDTLSLLSGSSLVVAVTKTLTVNGSLNNYSTNAVTLPGNMVITSGGNYIMHAVGAAIPSTNVTYAAGSNLYVLSCGETASRIPSVGGNIIWNCPSQTAGYVSSSGSVTGSAAFLNSSAGTYSIGGNLVVRSTGTGTINVGSGGTTRILNITGNLILEGGIFEVAGYSSSNSTTQTVNVGGNVIVQGGTLYISDNIKSGTVATLSVGGNVLHTGGVLGNVTGAVGGTMAFNGTTMQQFSTIGLNNAVPITVNNASGVALENSMVLSGALTLTAGKIYLGNNSLSVSSLSGGSSSSYIVTDSAGMLSRYVDASAVVFPIGVPSSYNPVTITNTGTADTLRVRVQPFSSSVPDTSAIVNRQWFVSEAVSGGSNVTLQLQWNSGEQASAFNPSGNIFIGRDSSSHWSLSSAVVGGSDPYTATVSNIQEFSDFVVGDSAGFYSLSTAIKTPSDVSVPTSVALNDNYPNPFNPSTKIVFQIPVAGNVTLKVFTILGQEIATLFNGWKNVGVYQTVFDAQRFSSGVYFYRLQTGTTVLTKRMVLLK